MSNPEPVSEPTPAPSPPPTPPPQHYNNGMSVITQPLPYHYQVPNFQMQPPPSPPPPLHTPRTMQPPNGNAHTYTFPDDESPWSTYLMGCMSDYENCKSPIGIYTYICCRYN